MEREDIRKMLIERVEFTPKKKSEETVWKFTCDSNLIKSKWVSYLAQLREHFFKQSEGGKMNWDLDNKSENRSSVSNLSNTTKTPWRESTILRKQYSVNDVKSMADLEGRDMEMDMYFDRPPSKKFELNRLTSSYSHEINLEDFAMEEEKGLTMTTPGLKMEMKMKKLGSTSTEVNLKKIY